MRILDRRRRQRRIRIDIGQLAEDLARRLPELDQVDLAKAREAAAEAIQDASARARSSLDRAGERARGLRADRAAPEARPEPEPESPLGELTQWVRSLATGPGVAALMARLERELPDTDRDRYDRAYARGWMRARTVYLAIGIVVGVAAGLGVALLLEPRRGRERREALRRRASGLRRQVSDRAQEARTRIQERDSERPAVGVMDVPATALPVASGPIPEAGADPEAGAHEALQEAPAVAAEPPVSGDPTDPTIHG